MIGISREIWDNISMITGGFFYHYLAFKYRRTLWRPFIRKVGGWLNGWEQKSLDLILVGPSAGYSLPPEFIYRYDRVIVIEKDPLAKWLFKKRFNQTNPIVVSEDLAATLPQMLNDYPDADLVFCNVLGQVFIDWKQQGWSEKKFNQWKSQLKELLKSRYWCSYHDLYSLRGKIDFIRDSEKFSKPVDVDDLIKSFATKFKMKSVDVVDHLTHDLFLKGQRLVQHWQLTPQSHFFIELIRSEDVGLGGYQKPSHLEKLMATEHQI